MSKKFKFYKTPLKGLFTVRRSPMFDNRGSFERLFCIDELKEIGLSKSPSQINYSITKHSGTIRGMHFQHPPFAECKVISCISGEVFDVAIDIRKGSQTFLEWHGEVLSERSQTSLYIPEGFAHGYQTLTDDCQLLYIHTDLYTPSSEGTLNAFDPLLAIDWPLKVSDISERDHHHSLLDSKFEGITLR